MAFAFGARALRWRDMACSSTASAPADKLGALLALLALIAVCATSALPQLDVERQTSAEAAPVDRLGQPTDREVFVGGYTGVPYTYPGDVLFEKPDGSKFTVHEVGWDAKPFDDPIYYGARLIRWSRLSPVGGMIDFTHAKAYSQRDQEVKLSGDGIDETQPAKKIRDIFHHFEFTHGHNMLTLNGLIRLPWRTSYFSPYIGLGAGVSIPHTEVQFRGERGRTYEYQFTGPVLQVVAGLEIRVPRLSYFVEYKFTFAPYRAPLHLRDGTNAFADLWLQLLRWWDGRDPAGGWLTTELTSHQVIAGLGYRSGNVLAAAP